MKPSLPFFDDSWILDLDVESFPDLWPQDEILSRPKQVEESYDEISNAFPQRDRGSWQNAPDQGHQPVSNAGYDLEEFLMNNSWEIDSVVQSRISASKSSEGNIFDCLATDSMLPEQPVVESRFTIPTDTLAPPSSSKVKTRKRRRLSDSTKAKAKSVRRVGAYLRCRLYKEPV